MFTKFRPRIVALLILAVALVSAPGQQVPKAKLLQPSYVLALATANRFLDAWQQGDLETGIVLLSDRVRHSQTPESLENLFSSGTDRAFEITRGKSDHGRYRFPVVMVFGKDHKVHRKFFEIVLVDSGKNDWAVDRLP